MKMKCQRLLLPAVVLAFAGTLFACAPITTLTVNSNNDVDDGACNTTHCSLREAINKANTLTGTITIKFDIGGGGVQTINPLTNLPVITAVVVIDGTTQPGFTSVPLIELDGSLAVDPTGSGADVDGLVLAGGGSTVKYLVINRFSGNGIRSKLLTTGGNYIENNYIGTDTTGTVAMGNGENGVLVENDGNNIGDVMTKGNVISANGENGVFFSSGGKNYVQGNLIGTDVTGTAKLGNGQAGVLGTTDMIQIGGTTADYRNVISGNGSDGVRLECWTCQIQGNYIGTDIGGFHPLGNYDNGVKLVGSDTILVGGTDPEAGNVIADHGLVGVFIDDDSKNVQVMGNKIGTDAGGTAALPNVKAGVRVGGTNNQIGVPGTGGRNLISGNMGPGIAAVTGATNITIQNNYIGTDASGTAAIGNSNGIEVSPSTSVIIGGSPYGEGNLISGNDNAGILLGDGTKVRGNYIGTDNSGLNPLGNGEEGILIKGSGNEISGAPAYYNTIAFNGGHGVAVLSGSGSAMKNAILRNSIHDNGGLGIAIDQSAVIPNDNQDPDTGDNLRQNYPVLTEAISDPVGPQSTISGKLNSTPGTTFTIEIYTNATCDPSGHGEGHRWIHTLTVTTNASGDASFTALFPMTYIDPANVITATATDPFGNTSGFSKCIQPKEPEISTPTPTPSSFFSAPIISEKEIFWGGDCLPNSVEFTIGLTDPTKAPNVVLFVRLEDKATGEQSEWGGGFLMKQLQDGRFWFRLNSNMVPEYDHYPDAWLHYQFVVTNEDGEAMAHSEVFRDISFKMCPRAGRDTKPG